MKKSLIASKSLRYGGRRIAANGQFEASPRDARLLVAARLASDVPVEVPASPRAAPRRTKIIEAVQATAPAPGEAPAEAPALPPVSPATAPKTQHADPQPDQAAPRSDKAEGGGYKRRDMRAQD